MAKTYELSISRDYVADWGVKEAVRELIQNAIDEGDSNIYIDSKNVLHIENSGSIPIQSLILGNTTKREDLTKIGQFGEGYKLALLVLTRMDKKVTVENDNELWTPRFKKSRKFNCEVLTIDTEETKPTGKVEFIIENLMYNELSYIVETFPLIFEKTVPFEVKETPFGQIILDKEQAGKFYVQGLPIFEDSSFKYGYNFSADVVSLDRDRKSINLYELKEIASRMIAQVEDPKFIEENISTSKADSEYLRSNKVELDEDQTKMMQDYLSEKYEVEEDSIVITDDDKNLDRELDSMGYSDKVVKVPNSSIKRILNTNRDTKILEEAMLKKHKVDEISEAYWNISYETSEDVLKTLSRHQDLYEPKLLDLILDDIQEHHSGFELIRDEVKTDVLNGTFNAREKNGR